MASKKKTIARKAVKGRKTVKEAFALARKAKRELEELLKRRQAGTISQVDLDLGLEEVYEDIRKLVFFKRHSLR